MMESSGLAASALLGLLLGLGLLLAGQRIRKRRGLGAGKTVSLDKVTLTSQRLGLTGRPDRLYRTAGTVIIEEWKSSRTLQPWHQAQMGVYFLLAEERFKVKPSHGFLVTGDGTRHRIENDAELQARVLRMAEEIRQHRAAVHQPVAVDQPAWKCRPCGMRGHCQQSSA